MPKQSSHTRQAPRHTVIGEYEDWHWPLPEFPELLTVGRDTLRKVKGLKGHAHSGYEICYIERGSVMWWVGREIHEVKGGEIFVTWPDELHGGIDDVLHPCKSYWLELDFPARAPQRWLGLPSGEARHIFERLKRLPRRRFKCERSIARTWDSIFEALERPGKMTPAAVRSRIVSMLVQTIDAAQASVEAAPISKEIHAAIERMDQNLEYPLPLPALAEEIGWSTSHFKRQFRREMGMPPAEFYLRRRLAAARERIEQRGVSLAQVAMEFGFSSSQYLATCFRRVTGRPPSSFRKRDVRAS
jgi:AraC-like DNA-binding protein